MSHYRGRSVAHSKIPTLPSAVKVAPMKLPQRGEPKAPTGADQKNQNNLKGYCYTPYREV